MDTIQLSGVALGATLTVPPKARGVIVFAHGSGSSRLSPRNQAVAATLRTGRFATLLMDLLTEDEERDEQSTAHLRFDIELLADRLVAAVQWLRANDQTDGLPIGLFGASTGAAAALVAAARQRHAVRAVVSRGGRPDLAGESLEFVRAPTLLIVGSLDETVLALNREAMTAMSDAGVVLEVIEEATHLFEEPGALERVADLARAHFARHVR